MSEGNKRCMYFIAQTYDISDLKRLKQLAYRDLLMRQQYLGELHVQCTCSYAHLHVHDMYIVHA